MKKEGFLKEKIQGQDGTVEWDERFFSIDFKNKCLIISMAVEDGSTKADKLPASDLSLVNLWGGEGNDENFDILLTNGLLRSLKADSREESRKWCTAIEKLIDAGDSTSTASASGEGSQRGQDVGQWQSHSFANGPSQQNIARSLNRSQPLHSVASAQVTPNTVPAIGSRAFADGVGAVMESNQIWNHISQLSQQIKSLTARASEPTGVQSVDSRIHAFPVLHGLSHESRDTRHDASLPQKAEVTPEASTASNKGAPARMSTHTSLVADLTQDATADHSLVEQLNASLHDMQVATRKVCRGTLVHCTIHVNFIDFRAS